MSSPIRPPDAPGERGNGKKSVNHEQHVLGDRDNEKKFVDHEQHVLGERENERKSVDPEKHVLSVGPLNSIMSFDPDVVESWSPEAENEPEVKAGPGVMYWPSHPQQEEWYNTIAAMKGGVGLTGTAALGMVGPSVGLVDIGEMKDAYMFRMSFPGVVNDEKLFSCDVKPDGKVLIKGVSTTGEKTVYRNSQVFKMKSQNLCPPGPFSISFELPGPVDEQQIFIGIKNGVLEAVVRKK